MKAYEATFKMHAGENSTRLIGASGIKQAAAKADAEMMTINQKSPGSVVDILKIEVTTKFIL